MADPTICPITRQTCGSVQICWLIFCAKTAGGPKMRPIRERDLTKEEQYALHMARQREGG